MGISQKHNSPFLSTAQKHNAQFYELNSLTPSLGYIFINTHSDISMLHKSNVINITLLLLWCSCNECLYNVFMLTIKFVCVIASIIIMCITGTSPHTYDQQQVRPGENQVRVRAKCPGQSGGAVVKVLRIGML